MAIQFKDYNGNPITFEHTHVVTDTINSAGTTAIVTTTQDGFMNTTDKSNLDIIENQILFMNDKIKQAVYIKPVTPADVALTFNDSTSKLQVDVYNGSATEAIIANVSAKKIGTLTYSWTATWYYKGPNWDASDVIGTGYFANIKTNTITAANINSVGYQPYSLMQGTVTITNTVETLSSRITKSFEIYYY